MDSLEKPQAGLQLFDERWERLRQQLYEAQKEYLNKKTPLAQTEVKGKFVFAKWSYMLDEMNRLHPLRSEHLLSITFDREAMVYEASVSVTDLVTKEERCGTDSHPVVAFDANSNVMKDMKTVRELLGNARKAANTKALRNAYSGFGVCADLYESTPSAPPNEEQNRTFAELGLVVTNSNRPNLMTWWDTKIVPDWSLQTEETAKKFLEQLNTYLKPYMTEVE